MWQETTRGFKSGKVANRRRVVVATTNTAGRCSTSYPIVLWCRQPEPLSQLTVVLPIQRSAVRPLRSSFGYWIPSIAADCTSRTLADALHILAAGYPHVPLLFKHLGWLESRGIRTALLD